MGSSPQEKKCTRHAGWVAHGSGLGARGLDGWHTLKLGAARGSELEALCWMAGTQSERSPRAGWSAHGSEPGASGLDGWHAAPEPGARRSFAVAPSLAGWRSEPVASVSELGSRGWLDGFKLGACMARGPSWEGVAGAGWHAAPSTRLGARAHGGTPGLGVCIG